MITLNNSGAAHKKDFEYLEKLNAQLILNPNDYNTLLKKALLLYYPFYQSDEAEKIFEYLEEKHPSCYEAFFWHGESLSVCDGDYIKASKVLRYAITIDNTKADAYFMLALTLDMINDSYDTEIESLLKTAYAIEPLWPNIWDGIISFLIDHTRFQEARNFINNVTNNIPNNYTPSDDIIQKRHDELVSGKCWIPSIKNKLDFFLLQINEEEATLKNK